MDQKEVGLHGNENVMINFFLHVKEKGNRTWNASGEGQSLLLCFKWPTGMITLPDLAIRSWLSTNQMVRPSMVLPPVGQMCTLGENMVPTHLFHIFTLSALADNMAVLSELKQSVRTSVRWPGMLTLDATLTSDVFSVILDKRVVSSMLLVSSDTTCNTRWSTWIFSFRMLLCCWNKDHLLAAYSTSMGGFTHGRHHCAYTLALLLPSSTQSKERIFDESLMVTSRFT